MCRAVREAVGEERYVRLEPMIRAVLEGYRQSFEIDFPAPKEGWGASDGSDSLASLCSTVSPQITAFWKLFAAARVLASALQDASS